MSDTNKALIQSLETAIKEAYSVKNFEVAKAKIQEMAQVDPHNRLAEKILAKTEKDSQLKAPGFWSKLFAKKEGVAPKAEVAMAQKETAKESNAFTQLFVKEAPSDEKVIDTIVTQSVQEKSAKMAKEEKWGTAEGFAKFANVFFQFSILFIVMTAAFFYVQNLDTENRVLGLLTGQENVASQLHASAEELNTLKQKEIDLVRQSTKLKKGVDNQSEEIVKKILQERIDWSEVIKKIDEVTDSVYENNALAQYIRYESYAFDAEAKKVTLTGSLSDPLGKNLTKLIELEQAFKNYPRNPDLISDTTAPYFKNVSELRSVNKSLDSRTGKFVSTFQVSFSL